MNKVKWESNNGRGFFQTKIGDIVLSCYSRIQITGKTEWYAQAYFRNGTFLFEERELDCLSKNAKEVAVQKTYELLLDLRDGAIKEIETFERLMG